MIWRAQGRTGGSDAGDHVQLAPCFLGAPGPNLGFLGFCPDPLYLREQEAVIRAHMRSYRIGFQQRFVALGMVSVIGGFWSQGCVGL